MHGKPLPVRSASRYLALKKKLHQDFAENQVDVYGLNAHDLTKIWIADHLDRGLSELQISEKFGELLGVKALEFTENGFHIVDEYGATAITLAMDSKVMVALTTGPVRHHVGWVCAFADWRDFRELILGLHFQGPWLYSVRELRAAFQQEFHE